MISSPCSVFPLINECDTQAPPKVSHISYTDQALGVLLCTDEFNEGSEFTFLSHCTYLQNQIEPGRLHLRGALDLKQPGYFDIDISMWRRLYVTTNGVDVHLLEDTIDSIDDGCDGELTIWPASIVLSRYLETSTWTKNIISNQNILELGAGAGLPSLCCTYLGAKKVLVSEGGDIAMKFLRQNINHNRENLRKMHLEDRLSVVSLFWGNLQDEINTRRLFQGDGDENGSIDFIHGSDITYNKNLHEPLVNVLSNLMEGHTVCVLAHDITSTPLSKKALSQFKILLQKQQFTYCEISPWWRKYSTQDKALSPVESVNESMYEDRMVKLVYIRKKSPFLNAFDTKE